MSETDYTGITKRQRETWGTGDFTQTARQNWVMAEALVEAVDPHPDDRTLDVACGSGNAALVAARRYCEVTGIDYVPELIERAEMEANAAGLEADFRVADGRTSRSKTTVSTWCFPSMVCNLPQIRSRRRTNSFRSAGPGERSDWPGRRATR